MKASAQPTSKAIQTVAALVGLVFFIITLAPTFAADFTGTLKGVTITDSQGINKPPAAAFTYTVNGKIVTFDASGSSGSERKIVELNWDFGDGAKASGVTATHEYASLGTFPATLTVIDSNGSASLYQSSVSLAPKVDIAVNFQPDTTEIPAGFVSDSGENFDAGRGYGWTVPPASLGTRERNDSRSPDKTYDTFIHVVPTAIWEYAIPNGKYHVTVTVGDPTCPDSTNYVQVEGISLIESETLNAAKLWVTRDATVNVADNRLTLTFKGSNTAKICWVKISSM